MRNFIFSVKFIILILLSLGTNCLYFHLYQNEKKCVYDEFYSELVIMVRYSLLDKGFTFNKESDNRLEITLYNIEEKKIIYKYQSGKLTGKFSHTIEKSGHYKVCVSSNDDDLFTKSSKLKFSLMIDTDQDEIADHSKVVKNKDFEAVDSKVRKMVYKANEISKMQEYQITTEDEFSQTQFSCSNRIVFMTIIQIIIISLIGVWQIYSLRKIFKEKAWSPF